MNRAGNLTISFLISVALHGVVALGVVTLVMVGTTEVVPVFKQGVSSVMITIEQPAISALVPVPEIQKNVPESVQKKPEVRVEVKKNKVEPIKAVTPPQVEQTKPVVSKREEPKPVVAMKPDDNAINEAEEDCVEDEMYHGDVFRDEFENVTDGKKDNTSDRPMGGEKADEGVQAFANTESFVDIHPSYPLGARMRGEEGVVVVRVTVSPSGRAENVEVMKSSGYASLDGSAVNAIRKARFVAKNGGNINGGQVTLPFRFKLIN